MSDDQRDEAPSRQGVVANLMAAISPTQLAVLVGGGAVIWVQVSELRDDVASLTADQHTQALQLTTIGGRAESIEEDMRTRFEFIRQSLEDLKRQGERDNDALKELLNTEKEINNRRLDSIEDELSRITSRYEGRN